MFFVINKEKVYAYVVSILTIVTLFFMSGVLKTDFEELKETSTTINTTTVNDLVDNNEMEAQNSTN